MPRISGIIKGKGFITFGKGNTTPPPPLPIIEGSVEHWAKLKGTEAWRVAAAKAHNGWAPHGAEVSETEFDLAVEEAGNHRISSR